jgi:hypothetical protein
MSKKFLNNVISLMQFYEKYDTRMTGYEKKEIVMQKIKELPDFNPDMESLIDNMIDIIILVDKNKLKIKKKIKKWCF